MTGLYNVADEKTMEDNPPFTEWVGDTGMTFKRLKDFVPGAAWILLLYGQSKAGKTYTAGTCGPRTLYLNTGNGEETLLAPAFTSRYPNTKDMMLVNFNTEKENAFDLVCKAIDYALEKHHGEFDWIVLDEATAFRKGAMNKSMELNTSGRSAIRAKPTEEFVAPDIQDFLREMQAVEWFLATYVPIFKREGKHFVMVAHERQIFKKPAKVGDEPLLDRIVPGFTGKTFPDAVPAYFDDVWHMEKVSTVAKPVYRIRTAGTGSELGDSRHGGIFEPQEVDPNLQKMLLRIREAQLRVAKSK